MEGYRMKRTGLLAVALAAAFTVACGGATNDDRDVVGTGGEAGVSGDLQRFVRDAGMAGTAEIELGRLASERATNARVKEFGQMMVRDHTMASNELKTAVGPYRIAVPAEMDEEHRELANKLRGMQGMEFDREYMSAMVDGHEDVKDMLEPRANETPDGDDPSETAVNNWAKKTLPNVDRHLAMAREIRQQLDDTRRNTTN
jgi:putative membrane protein